MKLLIGSQLPSLFWRSDYFREPTIGTIVGEFNATDPDGNVITYSLVSGEGDTHNSLFTIDSNGTLKTAATFDYESNASTYTIRVRATDEGNETIEGIFTVSLQDMYEPSQPNHLVDLNATLNMEMIWVELRVLPWGVIYPTLLTRPTS